MYEIRITNLCSFNWYNFVGIYIRSCNILYKCITFFSKVIDKWLNSIIHLLYLLYSVYLTLSFSSVYFWWHFYSKIFFFSQGDNKSVCKEGCQVELSLPFASTNSKFLEQTNNSKKAFVFHNICCAQ